MQDIILCQSLEDNLTQAMVSCPHDRLFVLTDTETLRHCWPLVAGFPCMQGATMITIPATDEFKTLDTLASVWTA
ncbi:MAG: 3-dehydroquinate synthase, partial [Bacteroidaceae bacterium]|nr:3-dehydroquinate synthase [Bacteroidaceae bacterium]